MGCTQVSRSPIKASIIPKNKASSIIISETANTLSQTNLISYLPTVKSGSFFPCLKIKLSKQFSAFILEDLTSLDSFSKKMHNIRKYWIVFQALKSNFECQIHSVCIKDYSLRDGLEVLSLAAAGKFGVSAITFCNESPFIKINTDTERWLPYKAWCELAELIEAIQKKGYLSKTEKYIKLFTDYIDNNGSGCYLKKALKLASEFYEQVTQSLSTCSDLGKGKLCLTLKNQLQEASNGGWVCPKFIVHVVRVNNLIE